MKINDNDVLSSSLLNIARTGAGNTSMRPNPTTAANKPAAADAIDVSSRSQVFSSALTAGEGARAARVAELRQLYLSGQYNPDAQEISGAIIDAHLAGG